MSFNRRLYSFAWILGLIVAGGVLIGMNGLRIQRVNYVSGLVAAPLVPDAASPTGYGAGMRQFIAPEHNHESYEWIAQTQQMLARGEWRVRHVDYDNAPMGRATYTASAYRWWLGMIAWVDHTVSHRPIGLAVERAALWADPLLQALFLISTGIFVARHLGSLAAVLFSVSWVMVFPLAGTFLPGQPSQHGLSLICGLWSSLPLVTGLISGREGWGERERRRHFVMAGIAGGLGLWINLAAQLPLLVGVGLGGLVAGWCGRQTRATENVAGAEPVDLPWRVWSVAGAATVIVLFLVEYFPGHLSGWRLSSLHPAHAVAWLGWGELMRQGAAGMSGQRSKLTRRGMALLVLALLGVAAVPAYYLIRGADGIFTEPQASRLTPLAGGVIAENMTAWLAREGGSWSVWATLVPLVVLGPAGWLITRRSAGANLREVIAIALGPTVVALIAACFQLRWWSMLDTMLLVVMVASIASWRMAGGFRIQGIWWWGGVLAAVIPGLTLLFPPLNAEARNAVTPREVEALIERDLSQWLATRAGPGRAIVLASPHLTTSLYFHGGSRGLGTPYRENFDGFSAALRIASATSPDEAHALVRRREVTHIVMPSWDPVLDEYARVGANQAENSLVGLLHRWQPPRWLRPVPYQLPRIPGFEDQTVVIFEVVDVQENAVALSYLAEYFAEMRQLNEAGSVSQALEQFFPDDLSALVARAQVASAREDAATFGKVLETLSAAVSRGEDEGLTPDRRVGLAIVLAEGKRFEAAKEQTSRCFDELTEVEWRSLTTVSVYRMLTLGDAFQREIPDPALRELARKLLPAEFRESLRAGSASR